MKYVVWGGTLNWRARSKLVIPNLLPALGLIRPEDVVEGAVLTDDDDQVLDRALGVAVMPSKGAGLVALGVRRGHERRADLTEEECARRDDSRKPLASIRHLCASHLDGSTVGSSGILGRRDDVAMTRRLSSSHGSRMPPACHNPGAGTMVRSAVAEDIVKRWRSEPPVQDSSRRHVGTRRSGRSTARMHVPRQRKPRGRRVGRLR